MKKLLGDFGLLFVLAILLIGGIIFWKRQDYQIKSPIVKKVADKIVEKPLEKYSFENLRKAKFEPSEIVLGDVIEQDNDKIISRKFYYNTQDPSDSDKKYKVSGVINMPSEEGEYPVIVMFRGFVERSEYQPGVGTNRGAQFFAQNGMITLAPDFLGYGESDMPEETPLEERFQTYPTAISLLNSVENLNEALEKSCHSEQSEGSVSPTGKDSSSSIQNDNVCGIKSDPSRVGIWGHSNGGHIALSVLAITGKKYPTVLWNPVTKPFPYSILFFTDEYDDEGKTLRKVVSDFEKDYDILEYSPGKYYDWIQAPIQLHQGEADDAVPIKWSNQFHDVMEEKEKDIEYFTYPGADHNLMPNGWNTAVARSLNFYKERFEEN